MSGFKGTPGRWEIHQEDGEISIRQAGTTERGLGWSSYTQVAAEITNNHDAKLIAAAPELLQALQEIWDSCCTNAASKPSKKALLMAHAAINKALGK